MARKLGSIQRIKALDPIIGADAIEKASVLGWELVVKKGEFAVGDLCVYCEIDSILPEREEFEFLRPRKFRIKTIKLKRQISQGICFPMDILPPKKFGKYSEDNDVTDVIGIRKHDPEGDRERAAIERESQTQRNRATKFLLRYSWGRRLRRLFVPLDRAPFPKFIPKTDEDRIQLFKDSEWEHTKKFNYEVTEKLDGQSYTAFVMKNPIWWQFWKPTLFGVCSRNFQLLKPDQSTWWDVTRRYGIEKKLTEEFFDSRSLYSGGDLVYIQGEILGPGVQNNKYKRTKNELNLFNMVGSHTLNYSIMAHIADGWDVPCVPLIEEVQHTFETIPEMVNNAKAKSTLVDVHREGVVWKSVAMGIHFKVINPNFLLKYADEDTELHIVEEWHKL